MEKIEGLGRDNYHEGSVPSAPMNLPPIYSDYEALNSIHQSINHPGGPISSAPASLPPYPTINRGTLSLLTRSNRRIWYQVTFGEYYGVT